MFQFVKDLFRLSAHRQPAPKNRLCVEALEAREVPTTIPLNWVGPQPEPPTRFAHASILFPVFKPVAPIDLSTKPGYASILFPVFKPVAPVDPSAKPAYTSILFPVFKPVGNTNPEFFPLGYVAPDIRQ